MRATGATTSAAAGMPIPLLALALSDPDAHQGCASFEAQNRIGGSRPGPGNAPGASRTATLDCTWGSRDRREDAPRVDGTTSYLLDGMSVIAQYSPDGSRQAWYTQSLARIDEVLSVVNGQGKFWYQADALGSTYALANGAGQVVARGGYDAFGEPQAISGNVGQPFGFTGREHERDSGLVYARDRYLSALTGAWTQVDRLGFVDTPNLYLYVDQRPTVLTDPVGAFPLGAVVLGAAVGGLFGFMGGWVSGLRGAALAQEVLVGVSVGVLAALLPVTALGPRWTWLVGAFVGAVVGALGEVVNQLVELAAGKTDRFSLASVWVAAVFGAIAGGFAGFLGPGSARWLSDPHVIERHNALVMTLLILPMLFGVAEWGMQMMITKEAALDAALDEGPQVCEPLPGR